LQLASFGHRIFICLHLFSLLRSHFDLYRLIKRDTLELECDGTCLWVL
jgi:hypothetical protein